MRVIYAAAGLAVYLWAGTALAEDVDCKDPQTQSDMTACAGIRQDEADAALNAQYKATRAVLAKVDAGLDADMRGAEKALVKAQRAWIDFRDASCEAAGFEARGGTMEPMLVADCLATLSTERSRQLKALAERMEQ